MADMRTLAALYVEFRGHPDATELEKDASSMFERTNWPILEDAIRSHTVKKDAKVKYGLKNTVYYLLMNLGRRGPHRQRGSWETSGR